MLESGGERLIETSAVTVEHLRSATWLGSVTASPRQERNALGGCGEFRQACPAPKTAALPILLHPLPDPAELAGVEGRRCTVQVTHDVPGNDAVLAVAEVVAELVGEGRRGRAVGAEDQPMAVWVRRKSPMDPAAALKGVVDIAHAIDDEDIDDTGPKVVVQSVAVVPGFEAAVLRREGRVAGDFEVHPRRREDLIGPGHLGLDPERVDNDRVVGRKNVHEERH